MGLEVRFASYIDVLLVVDACGMRHHEPLTVTLHEHVNEQSHRSIRRRRTSRKKGMVNVNLDRC